MRIPLETSSAFSDRRTHKPLEVTLKSSSNTPYFFVALTFVIVLIAAYASHFLIKKTLNTTIKGMKKVNQPESNTEVNAETPAIKDKVTEQSNVLNTATITRDTDDFV